MDTKSYYFSAAMALTATFVALGCGLPQLGVSVTAMYIAAAVVVAALVVAVAAAKDRGLLVASIALAVIATITGLMAGVTVLVRYSTDGSLPVALVVTMVLAAVVLGASRLLGVRMQRSARVGAPQHWMLLYALGIMLAAALPLMLQPAVAMLAAMAVAAFAIRRMQPTIAAIPA